jgi:hypothetical protein
MVPAQSLVLPRNKFGLLVRVGRGARGRVLCTLGHGGEFLAKGRFERPGLSPRYCPL